MGTTTPCAPRIATRKATTPRALAKKSTTTTTSTQAQETSTGKPLASAALVALSVMSFAPDALAKGGELGILEGRTLALLHPAMMYLLLRTMGDEIADLKQSLKDYEGDAGKKVKKVEL